MDISRPTKQVRTVNGRAVLATALAVPALLLAPLIAPALAGPRPPLTSVAAAALSALRPTTPRTVMNTARPPATLDTVTLQRARTVARASLIAARRSGAALRSAQELNTSAQRSGNAQLRASATAAVREAVAHSRAADAQAARAAGALRKASEQFQALLGGRDDRRWDIYGAHIWNVYLDRLEAAGMTGLRADQLGATGTRIVKDAQGPLQVVPATVVQAVGYAWSKLGTDYLWGGTGPDRFDCSGLTQQAYASVGINLPRVAADQWSVTRPVEDDSLAPGDLAWYASHTQGIHHVAIVLAPGLILNSPYTGAVVRVEPEWRGTYGNGRPWIAHRAPVPAPPRLVPYGPNVPEDAGPIVLAARPAPAPAPAPSRAAPAARPAPMATPTRTAPAPSPRPTSPTTPPSSSPTTGPPSPTPTRSPDEPPTG